MTNEAALLRDDIEAYLHRHEHKELLRFVVVGSVDDGKSTLIGRLLHDTGSVFEDQLLAVKKASEKGQTPIDFSLFTDGLKAEREQGITIDVAYRYFSTQARKFIIADTPGHVQYTRNMATGASTAQVGIILIDARLGVLTQSRRHAYIASLLGIPHLAVCINKMDLVGYDKAVYDKIAADVRAFAASLRFEGITFFPISALEGDNIVHGSENTPWHEGPTLLQHLEQVPIASGINDRTFRFPVQYVLRPNLNYRGFAGRVASGEISVGDTVEVMPSGLSSRVTHLDGPDGETERAFAPMSITIRLADEIDISRGDMLVKQGDRPTVQTGFEASLVWMSEQPLDTNKSYLLKHTTRMVRAEITRVDHLVDLETLENKPADAFQVNDIGRVTVVCHAPIYFDPYVDNRETGAFILIDSLTHNTVAAGMIESAPAAQVERRGGHSHVSDAERQRRLGHRGGAVLLVADEPELAERARVSVFDLERALFDRGCTVAVAAGDRKAGGDEGLAASIALCTSAAVIVVSVVSSAEATAIEKSQATGRTFRLGSDEVRALTDHPEPERAVQGVVERLGEAGLFGVPRG